MAWHFCARRQRYQHSVVQIPDVTAGIAIVLKALEAPLRQIAENSGAEGSIVVGTLLKSKQSNQGFNAQTELYVDMIEAGIVKIRPRSVRTALQDAGSIAGLLITAEAMIADVVPVLERSA